MWNLNAKYQNRSAFFFVQIVLSKVLRKGIQYVEETQDL